jgi:hypothetical protein
MTEPTRKVPELLVEQLALGELDASKAEAVRHALAGDDALARIEASNREILADYPPDKLAAAIRRRAEQAGPAKPSRSVMPWLLAPTMLAAALLVWVIVDESDDETIAVVTTTTTATGDDGGGDTIRIKGGAEPHLVIDRRTPAGHERIGAGELVSQGDLLQVSYVPAGAKLGVIISLDGAGAVTLHHPNAEADPPTLAEGSEVPLAHSYELDDAPGFERFVFVTRDGTAPDVAEVMRAAKLLAGDPDRARTAPLQLPGEGWSQSSLLLRKPSADEAGDQPTPTPAGPGDGGL